MVMVLGMKKSGREYVGVGVVVVVVDSAVVVVGGGVVVVGVVDEVMGLLVSRPPENTRVFDAATTATQTISATTNCMMMFAGRAADSK